MKLLISLTTLFFLGCATTPTLSALMRTSYYIGCGEARLSYIKNRKIHTAEVKGILKLCEEKSKKSFELNQTGIYNDYLEVVRTDNKDSVLEFK